MSVFHLSSLVQFWIIFPHFFFRGTTHKLSILLFFKNKQQQITTTYPAFFLFCLICRVASFLLFWALTTLLNFFYYVWHPLYIYPTPGPPILLARLPPFLPSINTAAYTIFGQYNECTLHLHATSKKKDTSLFWTAKTYNIQKSHIVMYYYRKKPPFFQSYSITTQ